MSSLLPDASIIYLFKIVGVEGRSVIVRPKNANSFRVAFYKKRKKYADMPGALNTSIGAISKDNSIKVYPLSESDGGAVEQALLDMGVTIGEINKAAEEALMRQGFVNKGEERENKEREKLEEIDYMKLAGM